MNLRTDCRICHSTKLGLILKLSPTPIGDQFLAEPKEQRLHPIDLYQCADCGLAQLLYEITPEDIYKDYLYLTSSSVGLKEHFQQYAKDVSRDCGLKKGDRVVDIGSNDGMMLGEFKALGMDVLGYEASEKIAIIAQAQGIPTRAEYFSKESLPVGRVKLVTANNVIANMNDLDAFMEALLLLLDEDGTFVFESFYLGDVVKNMVFDFIYHEHLSAFSIRPVKELMRRYGMVLYKTEHLATKGGSIRYYCTRYYSSRVPELPAVEDDDPALYDPQTYVDFANRIERANGDMWDFLERKAENGGTFCGFGASISATTLLYRFGIGNYLSYLVDDNPAKIGRFSPGLHLRVKPTSEAKTQYVIALAWRFAEDFKRAHPELTVVVPLPEFHIL